MAKLTLDEVKQICSVEGDGVVKALILADDTPSSLTIDGSDVEGLEYEQLAAGSMIITPDDDYIAFTGPAANGKTTFQKKTTSGGGGGGGVTYTELEFAYDSEEEIYKSVKKLSEIYADRNSVNYCITITAEKFPDVDISSYAVNKKYVLVNAVYNSDYEEYLILFNLTEYDNAFVSKAYMPNYGGADDKVTVGEGK